MIRTFIGGLAIVLLTAPCTFGFVACEASSTPRIIRNPGFDEALADLIIECRETGQSGPNLRQGFLEISANVNITNQPVAEGSSVVDAVLIVNENDCPSPASSGPTYGSCGAPDPTVQDPQYGQREAVNRLRWPSFELPVPAGPSGGSATVRVTGLRADAASLASTGVGITVFISSNAVLISNNVLNLAIIPPADKLGVFIDGLWFLDRNGDFGFDPDSEIIGWGSPGDTPVRADWNGDSWEELGVFSNGVWFLDRNGDAAFDPATEVKGWGAPGWLAMPGDWNGDGVTDLGVVDPATSTWFLDLNGDFAFDPATEIRGWGSPGDTPIVGDWNGDGRDAVGVYSGGTWFLDQNGDGTFDPATEIQGWGAPGWLPMPGDWNGDGVTDLGVVDPATSAWFLDLNGDFAFDPATEIRGWGSPGDTPIVGDWNADGSDVVGVFSAGAWFIDQNGDGAFDPATELKGWGAPGWTPIPGGWR